MWHDADRLAFEHREGGRAEVEDDVADVAPGIRGSEAEVAGDRGDGGALSAKEIHTWLGGRAWGTRHAAGTFVGLLEQGGRLVVNSIDPCRLGAAALLGLDDFGRELHPSELVLKRERRLHHHEVVDGARRAGAHTIHAEITLVDVDDVVVGVVRHGANRACRLAGVAADADFGVNQVLFDEGVHATVLMVVRTTKVARQNCTGAALTRHVASQVLQRMQTAGSMACCLSSAE
jgi:hypothetical protein